MTSQFRLGTISPHLWAWVFYLKGTSRCAHMYTAKDGCGRVHSEHPFPVFWFYIYSQFAFLRVFLTQETFGDQSLQLCPFTPRLPPLPWGDVSLEMWVMLQVNWSLWHLRSSRVQLQKCASRRFPAKSSFVRTPTLWNFFVERNWFNFSLQRYSFLFFFCTEFFYPIYISLTHSHGLPPPLQPIPWASQWGRQSWVLSWECQLRFREPTAEVTSPILWTPFPPRHHD